LVAVLPEKKKGPSGSFEGGLVADDAQAGNRP
jgi:hypothetical protein